MATFPSVTPTSRNFKPGTYPQKQYRSLSGVAIKRTFGNQPYGAVLQLEYANIPDDTVVTLIDHYRSQTAANRRFQLSSNVTAGMSSTLATRANASIDNLRWEYAEPPEISSVRPGINTVRINLAGEIRDPRYDD
jgi:hypothetical protein